MKRIYLQCNVNCGLIHCGQQDSKMLVGFVCIFFSGVAVTATTRLPLPPLLLLLILLLPNYCCLKMYFLAGTVTALSQNCQTYWCCCCDPHIWSIVKIFRQFATAGAVTAPFAQPTCQSCSSCVANELHFAPNGVLTQVDCFCPSGDIVGGGLINLWQQHWHCCILHQFFN